MPRLRIPPPSCGVHACISAVTSAGSKRLADTIRKCRCSINGRKVVVVSWRNGSEVYVANTGPAYPLRAEFKGQHYPVRMVFSEYDVPFDVAAPSNAIDASKAG